MHVGVYLWHYCCYRGVPCLHLFLFGLSSPSMSALVRACRKQCIQIELWIPLQRQGLYSEHTVYLKTCHHHLLSCITLLSAFHNGLIQDLLLYMPSCATRINSAHFASSWQPEFVAPQTVRLVFFTGCGRSCASTAV